MGRGLTSLALIKEEGSSPDPDGQPFGREKALCRLEQIPIAAYFSASRLKEGEGDMSASVKT
jgi:hypothetical protein